MRQSFDAYVTAVHFSRFGQAAFALGDGRVVFEGGEAVEAHDGAALSAVIHPSGEGLITGGDDGRLVWSRAGGAEEIAKVPGRWIESVDASPQSGLIAFAAGRDLHVRDVADPAFARVFTHEKSVADVSFEPKGRRIAAATYGGVSLWYAKIADQKPTLLKWAGSHLVTRWSPDGKFVMSAMQENQLHGWRAGDEKNMRMGGYPSKVRSLVFLAKGQLLATSGANSAVIWPFAGSNGPMGKQAAEVGFDESTIVSRVAAAPTQPWIAAGTEDGRVWAANLAKPGQTQIKAEKGAAITALAMSADARRVAWGDEDGNAGVFDLP